jgi:hypothetical protein
VSSTLIGSVDKVAAMLRMLTTELTPPFAMRLILRVWRRSCSLGAHTFEGCYPSIDAAPCSPKSYDDDTISAATVER